MCNVRYVSVAAAITAAAIAVAACTTSAGGYKGYKSTPTTSAPIGPYPLAHQTLDNMLAVDPSLQTFIKNAYGYAVFPSVSNGAFIVGGSYGQGAAFHANRMVARCSVAKGSIGAQVGGQEYSEVIFFQSEPYFDQFVAGHFAFSADVSAVAITAGAAANVAYNGGVAVFSLPKGGLMASAAVGGQKFSCHPASK